MNISALVPQPQERETFRRHRLRYIPEASGCYALTTFSQVVLYIGLTDNFRRRMKEHLDNSNKTRETTSGRAVFFYWIVSEERNRIERTWQNIHIQHEGALPELNKIYSPTFT
jgi:excinuclease UvrABC nuclease subunit